MLAPEFETFRDNIRKKIENELKPLTERRDWDYYAKQNFRILFNMLTHWELTGITYGKELGGHGKTFLEYIIAVEEIAKVDRFIVGPLAVHALAMHVIHEFGNAEQYEKYLKPMIRGEKLGAFALTEPDAGSDVRSLKTFAKKVNNGYILNGSKRFITNGGAADIYIVIATTDKNSEKYGKSGYIVEKNTTGFIIGKDENKMGLHGLPTTEIFIEECFVPESNRLGDEGIGLKIALSSLATGRISIAAVALGLCESVFAILVDYHKQQEHVDQFVALKIAEYYAKLESARQLIYHAAQLKDNKIECIKESSAAKLYTTDLAMELASMAINLTGKNANLERAFCDAKGGQIYEGANEIQKLIIAQQLLGKRLF